VSSVRVDATFLQGEPRGADEARGTVLGDSPTCRLPMTGVPRFTTDDASRIAAECYALTAGASTLPSDRDQNFLLTLVDGSRRVLKIANADVTRDVLEAEHAALRCAASAGTCPRVIAATDGADIISVGGHLVRMITALDGRTLGETSWQSDALLRDLGQTVARLDLALDGCTLPTFTRTHRWDLARCHEVIASNLALVADTALRDVIASVAARHRATVVPRLPSLRRSLIHGDVNDYNVLVDPDRQVVTGIIDFGDMVVSHTINDLAIAMAYVALSADDPLAAGASVVAGYHQVRALDDAEREVLFDLVCMRLAVSACIAAEQQAARPDEAYLGISQSGISRTLPALAGIHPRFAHYTFRSACGLEPVPHATAVAASLQAHATEVAPLLGYRLDTVPIAPIDLSVGSPLLSGDARANTADEVDHRVQRVLADYGAQVGVGGYDEARVMYDWGTETGWTERRTVHIGLDVSVAPGTALFAPLDGVVHAFAHADAHHDYGPMIVLRHEIPDAVAIPFYTLYGHLTLDSLEGLTVGQRIAKGQLFARVGAAPINGDWWPHVHVQIVTDMLDVTCNVDGVCRPSQRTVWRSLCPDPNLLVQAPAERLGGHRSTPSIASGRQQHIGRNLSVSYGPHPVHVERGWMQYLFDEDGRRYVDAYNNVAHVGHSHPRVVRAVSEQLSVLNTNTRYLQAPLVDYAETLTALMPSPLQVCFFTASGSEANELALRLARAYTGHRDLIVMDAAYHGHTTTLIDVSPYKHAGPGGNGAPDWVHTSPIPDVYRDRRVVGDPGSWFASQVGAVIDRIVAGGRGLCGYIAETCPSVGGQILMPPGFLANVYARVRRAGGVCIADEVQTGFGRLGTHFWAFEAHDVVPDIVVLGKPIANGYPMGAVVTTRAIADAFANGMEFFSTFGGSTAACAAARATLQVTLDEDLQGNALRVGQRLLEGLRPLVDGHPLVGDVRGSGLFLGIELVRDRETREPAAAEATRTVQRMRALGVLAGTDGPHHNVIKLRGPMPLTLSDADRIVDILCRSL